MSPPLVRSPLLIPRGARSAGGTAGRRVGLFGHADGYRIVVAGDLSRSDDAKDALAAVQLFNLAVRHAARAGLTSVPEPFALTVAALRAAEGA